MPPRRRPDQIIILEDDFKYKVLVRPKLAQDYFDMKKKLGETMECPICLEDIDCRHCFTLGVCGHMTHGNCWLAQAKPICPVCRFGGEQEE